MFKKFFIFFSFRGKSCKNSISNLYHQLPISVTDIRQKISQKKNQKWCSLQTVRIKSQVITFSTTGQNKNHLAEPFSIECHKTTAKEKVNSQPEKR